MMSNKDATINWWIDDILAEINYIKTKGITKKELMYYLDSWESTLKSIKDINKD